MTFHVFWFFLLFLFLLSPLVAWSPVLAPSWPSRLKSTRGAPRSPPSAQATDPTRLPGLSPFLPFLTGCETIASAGAALVRGEKPARSSQTHRYTRLRLSQSAVRVLRDHQGAHPRAGRGWQAWSCRADSDLSRPCLPHHLQCSPPHAPVPFENSLASDRHGPLCAGRRTGRFCGRTGLRGTPSLGGGHLSLLSYPLDSPFRLSI
jgi:hypothetical protein